MHTNRVHAACPPEVESPAIECFNSQCSNNLRPSCVALLVELFLLSALLGVLPLAIYQAKTSCFVHYRLSVVCLFLVVRIPRHVNELSFLAGAVKNESSLMYFAFMTSVHNDPWSKNSFHPSLVNKAWLVSLVFLSPNPPQSFGEHTTSYLTNGILRFSGDPPHKKSLLA